MTEKLITKRTLLTEISVTRGDTFEGFYVLLLDKDLVAIRNLDNAIICAEIRSRAGVLITEFNIERVYDVVDQQFTGQLRLWLTASQTELLTDTISGDEVLDTPSTLFTSVKYQPAYRFDLRVRREVLSGNLVAFVAGVVTLDRPHNLAPTSKVVFRNLVGAGLSSVNNNTYTALTNIQYVPPYRFTLASLSAVAPTPLLTFTATASLTTDRLTAVGRTFVNGSKLLVAPLAPAALPRPLAAGQPYIVRESTGSTCQLGLNETGSIINITTSGSITVTQLDTISGDVYYQHTETPLSGTLTAYSRNSLCVV
jgi:hypothetical protein